MSGVLSAAPESLKTPQQHRVMVNVTSVCQLFIMRHRQLSFPVSVEQRKNTPLYPVLITVSKSLIFKIFVCNFVWNTHQYSVNVALASSVSFSRSRLSLQNIVKESSLLQALLRLYPCDTYRSYFMLLLLGC